MSGFIDPHASDRARIERLEVLIDQALKQIGLDWMSPEVRAIYDDLTSDDPARIHRARVALAKQKSPDD